MENSIPRAARKGGAGTTGMTPDKTRPPYARLVWDRRRVDKIKRREPAGWTDWDRRFLASIACHPLPLSAAQRATLEWTSGERHDYRRHRYGARRG